MDQYIKNELADSSTSKDHQVIRQHLENRLISDPIRVINFSQSPPSPTASNTSSTNERAARKRPVPDGEKDEAYWEKRRRNNEAAKRSREKRRMNDAEIERKLLQLSKENNQLKSSLTTSSPNAGCSRYDGSNPEVSNLPVRSPLYPQKSGDLQKSMPTFGGPPQNYVSSGLPSAFAPPTKPTQHHDLQSPMFPDLQTIQQQMHGTMNGLSPLLSFLPQQALLRSLTGAQDLSGLPQQFPDLMGLAHLNNSILNRNMYQNLLTFSTHNADLEHSAPKQVSPDSTAMDMTSGPGKLNVHALNMLAQQSKQRADSPNMLPTNNIPSTGALLSQLLASSRQMKTSLSGCEADSSLSHPKISSHAVLPTAPANQLLNSQLKNCLSSLAVQFSHTRDGVIKPTGSEQSNKSVDSNNYSINSDSQVSPSSSIGTIESHGSYPMGEHSSMGDQSSIMQKLLMEDGRSSQMSFDDKDREHMTEREKYMERRRRNNEAAKKCRANRRKMYEERLERAQELEDENSRLRVDVGRLRAELEEIKNLIQTKQQQKDILDLRMGRRERVEADLSGFSGSPSSTLSQRTSGHGSHDGDFSSGNDSGNEVRTREHSPLVIVTDTQ